MLNLKAYLPSMEDFDSLPDTLKDDVSTDGENSYVAGIPEELIKPMENSEQSNENDGVITNMLQKQKKAEDTEEQYEETEERKFEEEHPDEESGDTSSADIGGGDEDAGTDEPVEGDEADVQTEQGEESSEEEDDTNDLNLAIESYSTLLANTDKILTKQSVAFLSVGLARLEKKLDPTQAALESFDATPYSATQLTEVELFQQRLDNLKSKLSTIV